MLDLYHLYTYFGILSIPGGGILDLAISQVLQVEGVIECNGQDGSSTNSPGGSGGFILVNTRDLEGSGSIEVIGGNGGTNMGAGGGGRMAINYLKSEFWFGDLNAMGGYSNNGSGGAGTVYLKVLIILHLNDIEIFHNGRRSISGGKGV